MTGRVFSTLEASSTLWERGRGFARVSERGWGRVRGWEGVWEGAKPPHGLREAEFMKLFSREGLKLVGVDVGGTGVACIEGDCFRVKGVGFRGLDKLVFK